MLLSRRLPFCREDVLTLTKSRLRSLDFSPHCIELLLLKHSLILLH